MKLHMAQFKSRTGVKMSKVDVNEHYCGAVTIKFNSNYLHVSINNGGRPSELIMPFYNATARFQQEISGLQEATLPINS